MKVVPTAISEVSVLEPKVSGDERGFFFESFTTRDFEQLTRVAATFVQDNHSKSAKNVLRGQHYQIRQPQGKLVRALAVCGTIYSIKTSDLGKMMLTRS